MASYLTNEESSYLLIPRKYFSRYVLAYEVILSSLCAKVNQKTLLNFSDGQAVVESGLMSDGYILLELSCKEDKNAYSITNLLKVWFPDNELRQAFLDSSYDNFDVGSLDCGVVTSASDYTNTHLVDITLPEPISKRDFVNMMMLEDGIMALVYARLSTSCKNNDLKTLVNSELTKEQLVRALVYSAGNDEIDMIVLERFIDLCLDNGIDAGWNPNQILCQLSTLLPSTITEQQKYEQWHALAKAFVNSENVPDKLFTDTEDGSIVLRAIILVLLNPELSYLNAMKEQKTFEIGVQVYDVAKYLTLLRSGFSILSSDERAYISEDREWIQNLNAGLHNNELQINNSLKEYSKELTLSGANQSSMPVHDSVKESSPIKYNLKMDNEYLTESLEDLEGFQVFDIRGLIPNSGFKLSLLMDNFSSQFSLWLVDLKSTAGEKKYKGKFALELVNLQASLEKGVRFEVDDWGVYLRFPEEVVDSSELENLLKSKLRKISVLKIINTRKTTFI
ncbi:hypothetical protein [Shewanella sp. 10N.286.52.B9]|uniref:hypothetical protein n=1 Tax=Shewanella sp. 10N.286.52.B9 TaxID=1880837 RepID=UPI000C83AF87|nr:hypothetical protein [Shewanella sp. 10N.286.52.B9]PMG49624.1 hypothetical protein BCU91_18290 [Shewanella sp. 10N.286.52.B9]